MSDKPKNLLTVAIATYRDFQGVWATVLALREYHGTNFDILVLDNDKTQCVQTKEVVEAAGGRYFWRPQFDGPAQAKGALFSLAETEWVMVCDSHVLFAPGAIQAAIRFAQENPGSKDLVSGPLVSYNGTSLGTHWTPDPSGGLWGKWGHDRRADDPWAPPFEIPMQGTGLFMMRREAFPKFHPLMRGFGAEEGYLHEKVRRAGGRNLCLPSLRWKHRFRGPSDVAPFVPLLNDHVWNLLIGQRELGIEATEAVWEEYGKRLNGGRDTFDKLVATVNEKQKPGVPYDGPTPPTMIRNNTPVRQDAPKDPSAPKPAGGPGTELKRLLSSIGLDSKVGCSCTARAAKMDEWGVEGCRERKQEILGWLREEYNKRGWRDVLRASAKALTSGLAFTLDPLDPVASVLDEAIRRAAETRNVKSGPAAGRGCHVTKK